MFPGLFVIVTDDDQCATEATTSNVAEGFTASNLHANDTGSLGGDRIVSVLLSRSIVPRETLNWCCVGPTMREM